MTELTPEEVQLFDVWEELDKIIESNQHKVPWILRQKVLELVDKAVQAQKEKDAKIADEHEEETKACAWCRGIAQKIRGGK